MSKLQIKAITFGLDGTLAHGVLDSEKYKKALTNYLHEIGYSGGTAKFNRANQAMLEKQRKSQTRNIEFTI